MCRTGKLSVSRLETEPRLEAAADCLDWRLESEDTLAEDCFISLASWRLEIWHSTAQVNHTSRKYFNQCKNILYCAVPAWR